MNKFIIYRNLIISIISIVMGFAFLYINITEENGGVPYENTLIQKSGEIDWLKKEKYGIKFQFTDKELFFNFQSKLGGIGDIYQALKVSKDKTVLIRYKETIPRTGFTGDVYHNVWVIDIDGQAIRSYEESESQWRNDEIWLFLLIPMFIIGGAFIGRKNLLQLKA
ncbi:hypothetical protein FE810_15535 [Thalassotalea litorea]|uniref:Uncharacterized protein n=1 Tax=Thalassotalea litorea TaxID=2020715 RepID=A0A5R9IIU7_9GAMM|nr:hypothetical protein [Thalassotalea litorea]TLU61232.1 hypothetical protein FE810_15535 [Thalassotalea litorea]